MPRAAPGPARRCVAILNQQDRVGKTTVTLGLASAAAGRRVLVVDPSALGLHGIGTAYVSNSATRTTDALDGSLAPKTPLAPVSRCAWRRPASGRTLDLTIHTRCGRGPKRSGPSASVVRVAELLT